MIQLGVLGRFDKILGKKIRNVECRKNIKNSGGQIYLFFENGFQFEISATEGLKGVWSFNEEGLLKADDPDAISQYFDEPVSRWFPKIYEYPEKRLAMGVSIDDDIETGCDYQNLLAGHLQNLIEENSEKKSKVLIKSYLSNSKEITDGPLRDWGEELVLQEEMLILLEGAMEEVEEGEVFDMDEQLELQKKTKDFTLEDILKIVTLRFDLSDDDKYLIEIADNLAVEILKTKNLNPGFIVSIGKFLHVLRRLPHQTKGSTYIDLTLSSFRGGETNYLSFEVSETRFEVTKGGSDGYSEIDWFIDIGGKRETDGNIYRLEGIVSDYLSLGYDISIEDESDFIIDKLNSI